MSGETPRGATLLNDPDAPWRRTRRNARVIMTIGLYGSASTWVFNVVRELMIARYGPARVRALYSDAVSKVVEDRRVLGRFLVWKMHFGEPQWDVFAQLADPVILLSVRDPRDAALSLVNRFNMPLEAAASNVALCCNRVLRCLPGGFPVLRYEDGFFRRPETVGQIAAHLGLVVDNATVEAIFARYTTEEVRSLADRLESLPSGQLVRGAGGDLYDEVTQIHRDHIGSGAMGKWRVQLNQEQQQALTAQFAAFLRRFSYA